MFELRRLDLGDIAHKANLAWSRSPITAVVRCL
jgi:hypothetical protein